MFTCDNPDSVSQTRDFLKETPYVLFDCEVHKIKMPDGSEGVSLVQLGTPHADDVFVFVFNMIAPSEEPARYDKHTLPDKQRDDSFKVGWRGIEDFSVLARIDKTSITPFLDLQLVDIHPRIRRGESRQIQIPRLANRAFPESAVAKLQIDGVHKLARMDQALVQHGLFNVSRKESE
ncbi:hypothetical protein ACEPAH_2980 [Sanghuangporus vaninii]